MKFMLVVLLLATSPAVLAKKYDECEFENLSDSTEAFKVKCKDESVIKKIQEKNFDSALNPKMRKKEFTFHESNLGAVHEVLVNEGFTTKDKVLFTRPAGVMAPPPPPPMKLDAE